MRSRPLLSLRRPRWRRLAPILLTATLAIWGGWQVYDASQVPLPTSDRSLIIAVQPRAVPFEEILLQAIEGATTSIQVDVYRCSAPRITQALLEAHQRGVEVDVQVDQDQWSGCPPSIRSFVKGRRRGRHGLYHPKSLIVDDHLCWVGSANFTPSGLQDQANLLLGVDDVAAAHAVHDLLHGGPASSWKRTIAEHEVAFYRLPGPAFYPALIKALSEAKHDIKVAMFVLTHVGLLQALEKACLRGILVEILLNEPPSTPDARALLKRLNTLGGSVRIYPSQEMLHAKACWIDRHLLVGGSPNWTKSAFKRNFELAFIVTTPLSSEQIQLEAWWNWIWARGRPMERREPPKHLYLTVDRLVGQEGGRALPCTR